MRIYDLHEDLILSYVEDPRKFSDPTGYQDIYGMHAGFYDDYEKAGMELTRGVCRPYRHEGVDFVHGKFDFDTVLLDQMLEGYQSRADQGLVKTILSSHDLDLDALKILLHVEGHDAITSLDQIQDLRQRGIRSFGFVRNFDNSLASCHKTTTERGLTPMGRDAIALMNEIGMMVDTAHMSHRAMMDVLEVSTKPILNSHSNLLAFQSNTRNVSDDFLRGLAKNGGVLGLSLASNFIENTLYKPSIDTYLLHIAHVRNLSGDEHVAFGSDYHGLVSTRTVQGLESVDKLPSLVQAVVWAYGEEFAEKFFWKNADRVIRANL